MKKIGEALLAVPHVEQPCAARLSVEIQGTEIANSWDWWVFPNREPNLEAGKKLAATIDVFNVLKTRYPGLAQAGTLAATPREVLLTDRLDDYAFGALDEGKAVMLLKLDGPKPGVSLGWWSMGNQRGVAVAKHPAFGIFPHDDYLSPVFFRIVNSTALLSKDDFRGVEPLMVGHGNDGYLAYVFQAQAGKGKLFATGLDVLAEYPEARCLLDQFVAYVSSERFRPRTIWDYQRWQAVHGR